MRFATSLSYCTLLCFGQSVQKRSSGEARVPPYIVDAAWHPSDKNFFFLKKKYKVQSFPPPITEFAIPKNPPLWGEFSALNNSSVRQWLGEGEGFKGQSNGVTNAVTTLPVHSLYSELYHNFTRVGFFLGINIPTANHCTSALISVIDHDCISPPFDCIKTTRDCIKDKHDCIKKNYDCIKKKSDCETSIKSHFDCIQPIFDCAQQNFDSVESILCSFSALFSFEHPKLFDFPKTTDIKTIQTTTDLRRLHSVSCRSPT